MVVVDEGIAKNLSATTLRDDAYAFIFDQQGLMASLWSSTTSMFEPDWAWALYLTKGAVGVGQKKARTFRLGRCVISLRGDEEMLGER